LLSPSQQSSVHPLSRVAVTCADSLFAPECLIGLDAIAWRFTATSTLIAGISRGPVNLAKRPHESRSLIHAQRLRSQRRHRLTLFLVTQPSTIGIDSTKNLVNRILIGGRKLCDRQSVVEEIGAFLRNSSLSAADTARMPQQRPFVSRGRVALRRSMFRQRRIHFQ